ncbi:M48 family metallopeptidase [Parendozoicomonas sp. Alg238-R29]|uniref:M48 metallopeptidase family protein n=1 Tax=Parendozoicomonas sp. Alg238-R29 TaxID=2993446 RepID=UPI00248DAFC8|nr:M48 family metallopeptidase [Parendozoicomonas sp. Alg238-R29]
MTEQQLKYLQGYPPHILEQANSLITQQRLKSYLLKKYPKPHTLGNNRALYDFTLYLKNQYLKKSQPLSKVIYDDKINVMKHALGLHTMMSRVQGRKLKSKNEIRIASVFKTAPEKFLRMIVVHELAHLKEKEHNKAFYQLCTYMEPDYHYLELDLRLYLTCLDYEGAVYQGAFSQRKTQPKVSSEMANLFLSKKPSKSKNSFL